METVRLTAGSPALVRRGALLLEDALRTASFPETGRGRVLLIRRLPVGVIHGHLPPASVALALERLVRQLAVSAVHALDPSAGKQDAVFFHDDAEPPLALVERLVRGEPATAWFWPLAVPDFSPSRPRDEQLRRALASSLSSSAGLAAAARLVEALHARGGLGVLLGALRPGDGPALLEASGANTPEREHARSRAARGSEPPGLEAPRLRDSVSRWVATWGPGDARSTWLVAVALVMERGTRMADPRLFERATRFAAALVPGEEPPSRPDGASTPDTVATSEAGSSSPDEPSLRKSPRASRTGHDALHAPARAETPPPTPERLASRAETPTDEIVAATSLTAHAATEGEAPVTPSRIELPAEAATPRWPDTPVPTTLGGLFFLVPVLERLGLPALLDAVPSLLEADVPERLFGAIARRLGAPASDAALALFGAGALGVAPRGLEYDVDFVLRGLRVAARRWCLRRGGLGLRALVQRPARILATRTHVDVLLDIRQADARIRGLGLDVDPGWVPWLGRVVRFHYLFGGD
ncbi:hypothetical protein LY474_22225 [Myxococcus stipitatus]|uniref:hypothetical protein n=1 Tax=Myxococcus stipitatus TaxID=83455 RepID=UPI001F2C36FC|nr:hypothetical protein [Myxococcus stipitatus]MCE9670525.1 hypothetical protein [Myxococcus stipitatus]